MHKPLTTLLALSLCLAAGCGGGDDDEKSTPAKAPAKTEKAAPASTGASGDVPSYATVKKLALKDPKVAKTCADGGEDRKIGISEKGETYTRLICGGNREIFDYIVGPKAFAENFKASVRFDTYDLWKLGSEAYVSSALGGPKTLAAAIKADCGCGETVKGAYGR